MNWNRTFLLLFGAVLLSFHAQAANGSTNSPATCAKDTLKTVPKYKFDNPFFFTLPKAIEPAELKEQATKESESSAI